METVLTSVVHSRESIGNPHYSNPNARCILNPNCSPDYSGLSSYYALCTMFILNSKNY